MYKFSEHGIKNKDIFCSLYAEFIDYCKSKVPGGTFSTYMDGEPYFSAGGIEFSYSQWRRGEVNAYHKEKYKRVYR